MSILESTIAPYFIILAIVAVLGGFFRKMLVRAVSTLLVMSVLFALFYDTLLLKYVDIIAKLRVVIFNVF